MHPGLRQGGRYALAVYREVDAPRLKAQMLQVDDKEVYALGHVWQGGNCVRQVTNRQTRPVGDKEAYAPGRGTGRRMRPGSRQGGECVGRVTRKQTRWAEDAPTKP